MLGTENQIAIEDVVKEILKTPINKGSKAKLLKRLLKYQGPNDNFKHAINVALKKVNKPYARMKEVQKH